MPTTDTTTCPKDGATVTLGDCCPTCGVMFDVECGECGQPGFHAPWCPSIHKED